MPEQKSDEPPAHCLCRSSEGHAAGILLETGQGNLRAIVNSADEF